ncbi:hypothetical protein NQ317_018357 [Molorchus minor]|uniref:Uncharacterized protein n=1 Tax=Molorchus minor TaxID=1323400 RepID=A0ABQ9JJ03_9CUCU|nr:hypothetical protein NQ317_018357 [Molorchus minor]
MLLLQISKSQEGSVSGRISNIEITPHHPMLRASLGVVHRRKGEKVEVKRKLHGLIFIPHINPDQRIFKRLFKEVPDDERLVVVYLLFCTAFLVKLVFYCYTLIKRTNIVCVAFNREELDKCLICVNGRVVYDPVLEVDFGFYAGCNSVVVFFKFVTPCGVYHQPEHTAVKIIQ